MMLLKVLLLGLLITSSVELCTQGENGCIICGEDACVACDDNFNWHPSGDICCSEDAGQFPDGNGACQACADFVSGCSSCAYNRVTTEVSCSQCDDESNLFLKDDGTCDSCAQVIPNCGGCLWFTDHTQCVFCDGNYQLSGSITCCDVDSLLYPDYEGGCDACENIVHGCSTCQMSGGLVHCIECQTDDGFVLSGAKCCDTKVGEASDGSGGCTENLCADGCTICNQNGGNYECQECNTDQGYALSGTTCCKSGNDQFPDSSGGCDSCANLLPGCDSCLVTNGQTGCTSCLEAQGYQLSGTICCDTLAGQIPDQENGGCLDAGPTCPTGCRTCNGVDCLSCETDYQLSGVNCCDTNNDLFPTLSEECGACASIVTGCSSCDVNSGVTICVACAAGYTLSGETCCDDGANEYPDNNGGCDVCGNVITGCNVCNADSGTTVCEQCNTPEYQLSISICCNVAEGFAPDGSGGCDGCPTGCLVCSSTTVCTICDNANDYYLSGETCCNIADNKYPDNEGNCDACSNVIAGCTTCEISGSATICSQCAVTYEKSGDICCDTNAGFVPDNQGGCASTSCSPGCLTCTESDQCLECDTANGYYLSGTSCCNSADDLFPDGQNSCAACSTIKSNCDTCEVDASSNVNCIVCSSEGQGYYLADGNCDTCENVIPGCTACFSLGTSTQCFSCEAGYSITSNSEECCDLNADRYPIDSECWNCQASVPGCETCMMSGGSVLCNVCQTDLGYVLTGNTCCDTNVATVSGTQCVLANEQCVIGCTSCGSTCSACDQSQGYQISGGNCCDTKVQLFPDGNQACKPCFLIHANCVTCDYVDSATVCTDCAAGFVPDDNGACVVEGDCPTGCSECVGNDCSVCQSGYTLYGTSCCPTGTFPNQSGGCEACSSLKSDCLSCEYDADNSEVVCTSCDTSIHKFLHEGSCVACQVKIPGCPSDGCLNFGVTQCVKCQSGYQLDVSQTQCCNNAANLYPGEVSGCVGCEVAVPGCLSCEASGADVSCLECSTDEGYVQSGVECCDTNNGQYPNNNACGTCIQIILGCTTCSFDGSVVSCEACTAGYLPDGSGGCETCGQAIDGCTTCVQEESVVKCTECDTNNAYHLSGDTCCLTTSDLYPDNADDCAACNVVIPGCSACEYDSQNSLTKCQDCDEASQEFPDGSGGCDSCANLIPNCISCSFTSQLICDSCDPSYALSAPDVCCSIAAPEYPDNEGGCGTCAEAVAGCVTCQINANKDGTECTECDTSGGFQLSGIVCCNTNTGSVPDGAGGCTGCPVGCSACENTECSVCDEDNGYYLSGTTCCDSNSQEFPDNNAGCDTCANLITGCSTCERPSGVLLCTVCDIASEFYPDENGGCGTCGTVIEGCTSCSMNGENVQCGTCDTGYERSGTICCNTNLKSYPDGAGSCQTCNQAIPGCSSCTYDAQAESFTCDECSDGYQLSGTKCCDIDTEFPNGSGDCQPCETIFPGCQQCIANSGSTECTSCDNSQDYHLSGTECCDVGQGSYPKPDGGCDSCGNALNGCTDCSVNAASTTVCNACDNENGHYSSGNICCSTQDDEFPNGNGGCSACSSVFPSCPAGSCIYDSPNTLCNACSQIIENCQQCRDASTCLICGTGFYESSGSCQLCSSAIPNCLECGSSSTCTSCAANYALINPDECHLCAHNEVLNTAGDTCVLCSSIHPECTSCSSENTCTSCGLGYEVNEDESGCYNCQGIDNECIACSSDTVCTECLSDYTLDNNACEPVPEGTKGTTDDGGQKDDCSSGCMSCSDADTCTICGDGFGESDSSCITCDSSCKTCQGLATTCTECYSGNYLDGDECKACSSNCLTCDGTECSACSDGFYPNGNGCSACGSFCAQCLSDSQCLKCDVGFTSNNGECMRCIAGCTICDATSIDECPECGDGYYHDAGKCHLCPENCYTCSDASTCQICETGYILNENDNTCQPACTYPCDTCSPDSPTQCLSCMAGHTLASTTCNPDDCGSSCTSCPRTQFLSGGSCQSCEANCDFCSDAGTCTQCSPGFFVEGNSCTSCPVPCSRCSSDQNCESCASGYYSEVDQGGMKTGNCKPCSEDHHCQECRGSASQCTVCTQDNYEFLDVTCVLKFRIGFRYQLNVAFSEFMTKVHQFKVDFLEALDHSDYTDTSLLHITGLEEGSTIVDAQIETATELASREEIYAKIEALNDVNAISSDFPIISLQNQRRIGWQKIEGGNQIDETFPWYAIVLLILLPILVIILAIKMSFSNKATSNSSDNQILSSQPITTSDSDPVTTSETF